MKGERDETRELTTYIETTPESVGWRMAVAALTLAAGMLPVLIVWGAWSAGVDEGILIEQGMGPRIWGYDCDRVDKTDGNEVRCLKRYPTAYIATTRSGLLVEPSRTNEPLPKVACDWTDREARTFIHWRDFDIHASHEDREGGFCESNRLWFTEMFAGVWKEGDGIAVLKGGVGMYVGRVCRPRAPGEPAGLHCDESKARGTCACVPKAWTVTVQGALVTCLSDDPKGCL